MTHVSNDPSLWPVISGYHLSSYFIVASSAAVVYDLALSFNLELELVWRQHWSFTTLLYISVRYVGMLYSVVNTLANLPVPLTDEDCATLYFIWTSVIVVVNAMLGAIMIVRIHAMYGGSKKILVFLIVALLACTIVSGVTTVMASVGVSGEEVILSGFHICNVLINTDAVALLYESLISTAVWEILAFFLAVWIVAKHFHELRQLPTKSTIGDCFMVLTKSHAFYFLVFVAVACLNLGSLSPNITYSFSIGSSVYGGIFTIVQVLQMFVLGPRLILSVRQYHAKLVAGSDEGTAMTSIAFQVGGDMLTGGDMSTGGDVVTGGDVSTGGDV